MSLLLSSQVSAVSTVVNWGTGPKAFVFRNYNHKPGSLSRYAGVSGCQMWKAVRASSAAPGYFQEFPLQSDIHQVVIHKTADVNTGGAGRFKGKKTQKNTGPSEQIQLYTKKGQKNRQRQEIGSRTRHINFQCKNSKSAHTVKLWILNRRNKKEKHILHRRGTLWLLCY